MEQSLFIQTALQSARRAGNIIMQNLGTLGGADVDRKSANDFVTRVDRESEQVIVETIQAAFPDHKILSEEAYSNTGEGEYRWVIDPLDGTTNYIHGYPMFAVSIALEHEGRVVTGVVHDPLRAETYTAEEGKGAFLNGARLNVTDRSWDDGCLITTGFPFRQKDLLDTYLDAFRRVFLKASGIRRAGAAALDLAHLAAGRCDGFFEFGLKPWDVAAGGLLIREAGGTVSDFAGGGDYLRTGNIVAGNAHVHPVLLADMKAVFSGIIEK
jgi:myo-inositol-1(or 4)-monophosphatase